MKIKKLDWDRQEGTLGRGSYVWPMGLHYYVQEDDGEWLPCLMIGDEDAHDYNDPEWFGRPTREEAEAVCQADFERRVMEYIEPGVSQA